MVLHVFFISKSALFVKESFLKEWKMVEERAIKALRLRHRSYRTERAYLAWLARFYGCGLRLSECVRLCILEFYPKSRGFWDIENF